MAHGVSRSAGVGAVIGAAAAIATAAGCGGNTSPRQVTYYRDVLPIVVQHCAGCHTSGGFAPFSLVNYDEARPYAGSAAIATAGGIMPPWPPAAGCGEFRNVRSLSSAEIATFDAWNKQGAPAGDPADAPATLTPPSTNLGAPSATLDTGVTYTANPALTDDYHCFLVDPGLTETHDLVGYDIHPGATASVHHVLLFAVSPDQLAAAQAKDDAEPGVGWTCFGSSGVGTGANVPTVVGGWVPGSGGTAFPSPTGITLAAGTQVVIQVHYNLLIQKDVNDRTTADLFFADAPVAKPARIRPIANTTFMIPAGVQSQTVMAQLPITDSYALWGVVPHMHLHGTSIKVSVQHAGGGATCAVDIPRWNFHWQQFYYFVEPLPIVAGDTVRLECTYDNSAASQPVVNGVRAAPEPLTWGDATTDEMCLNYLYFTAP